MTPRVGPFPHAFEALSEKDVSVVGQTVSRGPKRRGLVGGTGVL
jgi:hypothetical protein